VTDRDLGPVVQRAVDELRRLPPIDQGAIRRISTAAAAARLSPADEPVERSRPAIRWWATAGLAAAALIVGFVARGALLNERGGPPSVVVTPFVASPARPVASTDANAALVPQQFVLENRTARRVSVVGDFNNWNPRATPMTRSPDDGIWSVIVPVVSGRHVYGFMVDDSVFTLDPRNPKARDPDLGADASVLVVGRP
jgi:hypothetical protein